MSPDEHGLQCNLLQFGTLLSFSVHSDDYAHVTFSMIHLMVFPSHRFEELQVAFH
jgi:hypothetical protein